MCTKDLSPIRLHHKLFILTTRLIDLGEKAQSTERLGECSLSRTIENAHLNLIRVLGYAADSALGRGLFLC